MFLILFRNILCPQQMFPSLRSMEIQHSFRVPRVCAPKKHHKQQCVRNNVSSFARALIRRGGGIAGQFLDVGVGHFLTKSE